MRLHFDLAVTQRLLNHSKAAAERSPTCDQLYDGRFRQDGKDADFANLSADNFPTADDVDPTKIPPGLWLVGDHGIYLMSNGRPPLRPEGIVRLAGASLPWCEVGLAYYALTMRVTSRQTRKAASRASRCWWAVR